MAGIEAVCFDLDSTICVRDRTDEEIHEAVFERAGLEPFFTPADVAAVDATRLPTADSDVEFWEQVFRAVARDVDGDPTHARALAEAMVDVRDPTAVSFRPGAPEALQWARSRYDVALVTNGGEATQRTKLETLGIEDAFDATVFCDPAADLHPKPDPAPFRAALEALDATPETTIHVGDSYEADVCGALDCGLAAAWVPADSRAEPTDRSPTHTLDSPGDLRTVL